MHFNFDKFVEVYKLLVAEALGELQLQLPQIRQWVYPLNKDRYKESNRWLFRFYENIRLYLEHFFYVLPNVNQDKEKLYLSAQERLTIIIPV